MTHESDDAAIHDLIRRAYERDAEPTPMDLDQSMTDIKRRASSNVESSERTPTWHRPAQADVHDVTRRVTIGIITALPIERLAVSAVLPALDQTQVAGDPNLYLVGAAPSRDPEVPHVVAVAQQGQTGTRSSAALYADMARSFPDLRTVIMCGTAGGVSSRVALGDVVVATDVIDYGRGRSFDVGEIGRRRARRPAVRLLRADREMQVKEMCGEPPWSPTIERATRSAVFRRPVPGAAPRVHRGLVATSDLPRRDAELYDRLTHEYGAAVAIEMDGAGLADASFLQDLDWFIVRGISDLEDREKKDDRWQAYASLAAAGYVRALLAESLPVTPRWPAARADEWSSVVDALVNLPGFADVRQRRRVLSYLPAYIRAAIPDSEVGRLHVVEILRTCERFQDGREALVQALGNALGEDSADFRRVADLLRVYPWSTT